MWALLCSWLLSWRDLPCNGKEMYDGGGGGRGDTTNWHCSLLGTGMFRSYIQTPWPSQIEFVCVNGEAWNGAPLPHPACPARCGIIAVGEGLSTLHWAISSQPSALAMLSGDPCSCAVWSRNRRFFLLAMCPPSLWEMSHLCQWHRTWLFVVCLVGWPAVCFGRFLVQLSCSHSSAIVCSLCQLVIGGICSCLFVWCCFVVVVFWGLWTVASCFDFCGCLWIASKLFWYLPVFWNMTEVSWYFANNLCFFFFHIHWVGLKLVLFCFEFAKMKYSFLMSKSVTFVLTYNVAVILHSFTSVPLHISFFCLADGVFFLPLCCSYHFHLSASPKSSSVTAQCRFSWVDWWMLMPDTTAAQPSWPTEQRYRPAHNCHWPVWHCPCSGPSMSMSISLAHVHSIFQETYSRWGGWFCGFFWGGGRLGGFT